MDDDGVGTFAVGLNLIRSPRLQGANADQKAHVSGGCECRQKYLSNVVQGHDPVSLLEGILLRKHMFDWLAADHAVDANADLQTFCSDRGRFPEISQGGTATA